MTAPYPGGSMPPRTAPPQTAPPAPSPVPPAQAKSGGCLGTGLAVTGVLALIASGLLVVLGFTQRGQHLNPAWVNSMWRNAPAEKLFPANIAMHHEPGTASGGKVATWYRVGIAADTSCEAALHEDALKLANKIGCVAAPRATYVDATGNMVATVALIALKPGGAENADGETPSQVLNAQFGEARYDYPLVHAYPVPKTPAARWNDAMRNGTGADKFDDSPQVLAVTVGSTDGRSAGRLPEPWHFGSGGHDDRIPWHKASDALLQEFKLWYSDLHTSGRDDGGW